MNDMSAVIVPKSDQINADDLISGPMTITINEVRIKKSDEQPVDIYFAGSKKAYRPCKSMSRVLVYVWGPDAGQYIGKSLQLYRDEKVRFGKDAVGGIRISHMSDIPADKLDDGRVVMSLHVTRGQHRPHVVRPLQGVPASKPATNPNADPAEKWASGYIAAVESYTTPEQVNKFANEKAAKLAELQTKRPELHKACIEALDAKRGSFTAPASEWDDDFTEGKPDEATGEAFTDEAEAEEVIEHVEGSLADQFRAEIADAKDIDALAEIQQRFADSKPNLKGADITDIRGKLAERRNELV